MTPEKPLNSSDEIFKLAVQAYKVLDADALLLLTEKEADWEAVRKMAGRKSKIIVAADEQPIINSAIEHKLDTVFLSVPDAALYDKLTQALLGAIASELLQPGAEVIATYSGFEAGKIDTFSFIRSDEHLGRLTSRDLRILKTNVPLETLKAVVDLAVEIGREGREGKPVGTLFVVGDSRKVLGKSQSIGFDPVKGYNRKERSLRDKRVRESMKEIAMLDGAFVVSSDGTVEAACRHLNASTELVTLSKGLGTRHWAAAGITKETNAVAVAVSESSGTVRLFQNGEVLLRVEPFRRAMKWKDFEYDPPSSEKPRPKKDSSDGTKKSE